jgi:hypothetical protein
MKAEESKFGNQPPERVFDQFIREGKAGQGGQHFTAEQKKEYDKLYGELVRDHENKIFNR